MKNEHLLSVVVPAHQQAKTIVENIRILEATLSKIRYAHEIIVVVDGYGDGTYRKLKKAKIPNVIVTVYMQNQGKGHAVRLGMGKTKGDYVAFIDAGREIDPNGISMLLEHMEWYGADIIVGSKRHPVSKVIYPWYRTLLSFGYQFIIRLMFNLNIRDTQAGIKIFRREVLEKILPKLLVKRYAFDLEMLAVASRLGFKRIYEAPIKLRYNFSDITHASTLRSVFLILVDTAAIFYRIQLLHYYDDKRHKS